LGALVVGAVVLLHCATNPATGKKQISLIGEGREIEMGREAAKEISASMGLYDDDALSAYVDSVGQRLAATSERSHLTWTFRVVDDAAVNAFALPGGYIYVTRGILAHLNSEAELAGVLGHEIGHVTGRHSVNRLSKAQLGGLVLGVGTVAAQAASSSWGSAVDTGGQVLFAGLFSRFSRDHERQADDLGLRYMTRSSYDPHQMPGVFAMLEAVSSKAAGGRVPDWLATHPNPEARGRRSVAAVAALGDTSGGRVGAEVYLGRLESLTFGADPREGYFRESLFLHPEMRFQFDFPDGWKTQNQKTQVAAINPGEDVAISLRLADAASAEEGAREFLAQEGMSGGRRWTRRVNGLAASGGGWTVETEEKAYTGQVVFVEHSDAVFALVAYGLEEDFARQRERAVAALKSFRVLEDPAVLAVEPFRLEVVRLASATTLAALAVTMKSPVSIEILTVVNRREPDAQIPAGSLVKMVVGNPPP